jgi:hypothetical protein
MTTPLVLRRFDPAALRPRCKVLVLGKGGTGKTTLLLDLLRSLEGEGPYRGDVVNCTECVDAMYRGVFVPEHIHDEYSPDIVGAFLEGAEGPEDRVLVLDNCFFEKDWCSDARVARALSRNPALPPFRVFVALSYPFMEPSVRGCFDHVFVMRETIEQTRHLIYRQFIYGALPSFEVFCRVLDQTTRDYDCLVIDRAAAEAGAAPADVFFFYRASVGDGAERGRFFSRVSRM